VAELWSVVIACLIGFLGLAVPQRERNPMAAGLGVLYLAVAGIDLLHTLAFKGMGVFPGFSANPSTQFWILGRALETAGLSITVLFHRKKSFFPAFTCGVALSSLAGLALVFSGRFPDCYLPGTGLTPFKIATEWVLAAALLFSAALVLRSEEPSTRPYRAALAFSLLLTAASEMAFTLYTDVYGVMNMTGHLFKVASFYVLLVGVVFRSLKDPLYTIYLPILQAQEAFLKELMGPSFVLDPEGRLVVSNRGVAPGATLEETLPQEACERVNGWIQTVKATGKTIRDSLCIRGRVLDLSVQALRDAEGAFAGAAFISLDRTEEQRLADSLQQSENRYIRLFNRMQEGLALHEMIFDATGKPADYRFLEVNPAFARYAGLPSRDIVGKTVRQIFPRVEPLLLERFGEVVLEGKAVSFSGFSRDLGRWFEGTAYPMGGNRFAVCLNDRTAEKEAQRLLAEKENLYRALVEDMPALVCRFDENAVLSYVNEAYCRFFGKTPEELVGKSFFDLLPEEARQAAKQQFLSLTPESPSVTYEHEVILPDGTIGWQRWTDRALFDKEGRRIGFQSIGYDLTGERLKQNQIRLLSSIVESSLNEIYVLDPSTFRFEYANRGALAALGLTAEELIALTPMDIAPTLSRQWLAGKTAPLLSGTQDGTSFTTRHRRKDGAEYPVWIRLQTVGEGPDLRLVAIGLDMTERNRTLQALRGKTAELGQLFQNAPLGLFLCDRQGRVRKVNESAQRMFGFTRSEMIGRTIEELLVPEEDVEISRGHWKILFEEKRGFFLEARRRRRDRSPVWVQAMGFPLVQKGAVEGAYLIYQDITPQKEAKSAIEALNRQLENRLSDLNEAWKQTVRVLTRASEARDPYTAGHQRRVAQLARAIAEELGMEPQACSQVELAALVHDIGKIEVPSEILVKPGALSPIEFQLIQTHPEAGWKILKEIVLPWPLAEIVYQHHEALDGSGYPRSLKGEEILVESRIIAVADTVEAMASHRPYRPALGIGRALEEIEGRRGRKMDPLVVDACLRLFREKAFLFAEEENRG